MLRTAMHVSFLCLLAGLVVAGDLPARAPQADQNVQVIEMTAKKYEFSPSPVHVKKGAKVQLKITALDKTHGFKVGAFPDGAVPTGTPGLIFTAPQDCWKLEKGTATVIEFVAGTPGTYTFKCCTFCGFGHGGMKGQLIVDP
ncbi:MAG TPA: cupredoxin domain-containing protein [Candidatus Acidoferrales bacterium]|jgi:cytochrome c oxidase subunit 2|nr:cupredoxin domain-containing protein [Candidatus Acidoferrales bacterium]